jgi:hypothetical protein
MVLCCIVLWCECSQSVSQSVNQSVETQIKSKERIELTRPSQDKTRQDPKKNQWYRIGGEVHT